MAISAEGKQSIFIAYEPKKPKKK
nr:hypothetical protein [Clostridium sp. Cult3]